LASAWLHGSARNVSMPVLAAKDRRLASPASTTNRTPLGEEEEEEEKARPTRKKYHRNMGVRAKKLMRG
jgi:hypothetical protein